MADLFLELRCYDYRQLALRLREMASQARFPAARRELVAIAMRFDRAAGENSEGEQSSAS